MVAMTLTLFDHTLVPLQWGAVLGASLFAAYTDLKTRRIPNGITGTLFVTGLMFSSWIGANESDAWFMGGMLGLAESMAAAIILGLPFLLLFAFVGGGAGDAKLMGAAGAWLGLVNGVFALFAVVMVGAVVGLVMAAKNKQLRLVLGNIFLINHALMASITGPKRGESAMNAVPPHSAMQKFPYGVSIFLGLLFAAGGLWLWQLQ